MLLQKSICKKCEISFVTSLEIQAQKFNKRFLRRQKNHVGNFIFGHVRFLIHLEAIVLLYLLWNCSKFTKISVVYSSRLGREEFNSLAVPAWIKYKCAKCTLVPVTAAISYHDKLFKPYLDDDDEKW